VPDVVDVDNGRGQARVTTTNYSGITGEASSQVSRLSEHERPPVYGNAGSESQRLGGDDRYYRLREIAKEQNLSLTRPSDRKQAEAILFREVGSSSVSGSLSFAEAHNRALVRLGVRPSDLQTGQTAELEAEAARIVAREAPHTTPRYGTIIRHDAT